MKLFKQLILPGFLILSPLLAHIVHAQSITVFGSNEQARECYMNAGIAAQLPDISNSMLTPCDYALEHLSLSLADRAATFANRGILLMSQQKYDAALSDFAKAIAIQPNTAEIFVNRGNAHFLSNELILALDDYEQARELGIKQLHFVHFNMGLTFNKLGDKASAEREFRRALAIEPDWPLANDRLALLLESNASTLQD